MRRLISLSSPVACIAIGVLFVALTAVFIAVPYALGAHPWETSTAAARASSMSG